MADGWDPGQYERFAEERARPFHDLLALVAPCPGGAVVDLGCGTGELTAVLHDHTGASSTLGIDTSAAMLERAAAHSRPGLRFEPGDIAGLDAPGAFDVVFANAALQWVPDHDRLLERLTACLRPGGQLAVQVPTNADHASHVVAAAVAAEAPFVEHFGGSPPPDPVGSSVLAPEHYAEILHRLGYATQHVRLQVYGHVLPSAGHVVEWTKGTTLTRFRRVLAPEVYEAFLDRYRTELVAALGDARPYFYAFKRILFWARLPG